MSVTELIQSYTEQNLAFSDLSESQLSNLIAEWMLADCPGTPWDAKDYFIDVLCTCIDIIDPILQRMLGLDVNDESIADVIEQIMRDGLKCHVEEYFYNMGNS